MTKRYAFYQETGEVDWSRVCADCRRFPNRCDHIGRLRLFLVILPLLVLLAAAPAAAQNGPGWPIGALDGINYVIRQYDGSSIATLSGWTFHTGGAAVLELRVTVDCLIEDPACHPISMPGSTPYNLGYPRPDVCRYFAAAGYPVPENTGFAVAVPFSSYPDGWHQIRLYVVESQHRAPIMAAGAWFIKTGDYVLNGIE